MSRRAAQQPPALALAEAPFALRVTRRREGLAAILYRREGRAGRRRWARLGELRPVAYGAAQALLREAVRAVGGPARLAPGPWLPLDEDGGTRLGCFALLASGLADPLRLTTAAGHLRHADPGEVFYWFSQMQGPIGPRAIRALRILTEAVR